MPNLIRSFIAVPLNGEIHQNLADFIQSHNLNTHGAGLRPVKPANIHLTLKFLGDVESFRIQAIGQALDEEIKSLAPFSIDIRGLGAFPAWKKQPRVIWVGAHPADQLKELFSRVDTAAAAAGFPPENRDFSPHLTLARINQQISNPVQHELLEKLMNIQPEPVFGQMTVHEVVLFKSLLQPSGPVYTILSRHSFSGSTVLC